MEVLGIVLVMEFLVEQVEQVVVEMEVQLLEE